MQQKAEKTGRKSLKLPGDNLVWLHDHPEVCNKTQYHNQDQEFVVVTKHQELSVFHITADNGDGMVWTANWQEIYDSKKT